jgi:hypothetical protein
VVIGHDQPERRYERSRAIVAETQSAPAREFEPLAGEFEAVPLLKILDRRVFEGPHLSAIESTRFNSIERGHDRRGPWRAVGRRRRLRRLLGAFRDNRRFASGRGASDAYNEQEEKESDSKASLHVKFQMSVLY